MSTSSTAYQLQLSRFLNSPSHNNQCSDCKISNPTWCSTTFNVFLCSRCATLHSQLLNKDPYYSNIKSIKLDYWTDDDLFNFIHKPNEQINRKMYTTSDNAYDLEQIIKRKYIDPLMEINRNKRNADKRYPMLCNRRARDYELSKYASHIREIQSYDRRFDNRDNIVEALSIARGNIENAIDILRYNNEFGASRHYDDHGDYGGSRNNSVSNNNRNSNPRYGVAPSLPQRPKNSGPKEAVFDGSNIRSEPKPAIFDGSNIISEPKSAIFDGSNIISNEPKSAVFHGLTPDVSNSLQMSHYQQQQQNLLQQQLFQQQPVQEQQFFQTPQQQRYMQQQQQQYSYCPNQANFGGRSY